VNLTDLKYKKNLNPTEADYSWFRHIPSSVWKKHSTENDM